MKFKRPDGTAVPDVELLARDGSNIRLRIGEDELAATVEMMGDGSAMIQVAGRRLRACGVRRRNSILVAVGPGHFEFVAAENRGRRHGRGLAVPEVTAPMPGKVLKVLVEVGQTVEPGQPLIVLEAMKMETTLYAESAATIGKLSAGAGDMVDHGAVLIELTPVATSSANESPTRDG
jgi:3-methylcrotonyl-CoA carboxylase alpha subunit